MRVLVTGGAGFIGSHIVEYQLSLGNQVYAVDNLSSGRESNITPFLKSPNFRFINEDIIVWKDIEKIVHWADCIYHIAAVVGVFKVLEEPERVLAVNIAGTERLLRAIRKSDWRPRVIIASSSEVYGPSNEPILKEDSNIIVEAAARNRWHYSVSKLADESFGLAYYRKCNIPVTLIRFFNTIGPRQMGRYGMVVPRFVEQAVNNEPICVFGDGTQTRSFCDVRDTVVLLDQLANNPKSIGEIVNVGNDREISIEGLAQTVKQVADSNSTIKKVPYEQAYGEEYVDIKCRRPDLTKLKSLTNHQFQWTLERTLSDLVEQTRSRLKSVA
jgi:UDP-glucose 4-epimerase